MTEREADDLVDALAEDGYRARALSITGDPSRWGVEILEPLEVIGGIELSPELQALLSPKFSEAWYYGLA